MRLTYLTLPLICLNLLTAEAAPPARVCEPPIRPAFTPLPPGAVEPAGWLRDWALAAKNGITGHLDEYHPTFADGWKGILIKAPGAKPDGTGWPLEQCSYWLDGLVRLGYVLHDEELIKKARTRLDLVVDGVNRSGNSFIYWKEKTPEGFDSWAHSQMGRALVAYYAATGDKQILNALVNVYRQYPVAMGDLHFTDVSGLCNLDAMLETYAFSGDRTILDRAQAALASAAPEKSIHEWQEGRFNEGHAVITYENIRLPALLYPWTGQALQLETSLNAFRWLNQQQQLPYGVASGEEYISGIGAFRLTETCNVAADLWSSSWLYRITGNRSWGDSIEQLFFNAGPAPIARDFQTMCYYQSPNRIQADTLPEEQPNCPGHGCLHFTKLGQPSVLCCVGAVNRILPNYIIHMWMATQDRGLAATLYGPCTVTSTVGNSIPVTLTCKTAYPFEETIQVTVTPKQKAQFPLYFRIPKWCGHPRLAINNNPMPTASDQNGFVRIERDWSRGDRVTLTFPMSVDLVYGAETGYPKALRGYFKYKPDEVFEKRSFPFESIQYGPLLFALPIADKDPNTPQPDARWQFALNNDTTRDGADIEVERSRMPAKWNWPLNAPIILKVPARSFEWKPTNAQALPPGPVAGEKDEIIRLVPYGCTKFRISMFPVTARAAAKP